MIGLNLIILIKSNQLYFTFKSSVQLFSVPWWPIPTFSIYPQGDPTIVQFTSLCTRTAPLPRYGWWLEISKLFPWYLGSWSPMISYWNGWNHLLVHYIWVPILVSQIIFVVPLFDGLEFARRQDKSRHGLISCPSIWRRRRGWCSPGSQL